MSELQLKTGGKLYGGWTEIDVRTGIDRLAGTFELKVAQRGDPANSPFRDITVGQHCEIRIDDETLITGWVDEVEPSYDAESHIVAVRGRDATGDLVDCSVRPPYQFLDQSLTQIAVAICKPFGVNVSARTDVGAKFSQFNVQPSESVFEALGRLVKRRGVLLVSDGRGNLVITRASSARVSTVLQRGVNILAANGKRSHLERFSNYHVLSQTADDPAVLGEATDRGVSRYRPLDILAEEPDDTGAANTRADWEMRTRAGRAVEAEFTVQGWKHMQGLWRHDTAVTVRDPWLDIDGPMYISGVRYTLGAEGTKAVLTTTLRQAFDRIPMPDPSEEPMP